MKQFLIFSIGFIFSALIFVPGSQDYAFESGSVAESSLTYYCMHDYLESRDYVGNPIKTGYVHAVEECVESMYGADDEETVIKKVSPWWEREGSISDVARHAISYNFWRLMVRGYISVKFFDFIEGVLFMPNKANASTEKVEPDFSGYFDGKYSTPKFIAKRYAPNSGDVPTFDSPAEVFNYRNEQSRDYETGVKPTPGLVYLPYEDTVVCVRMPLGTSDFKTVDSCFSLYDLTER